jgi:hypothetical protein
LVPNSYNTIDCYSSFFDDLSASRAAANLFGQFNEDVLIDLLLHKVINLQIIIAIDFEKCIDYCQRVVAIQWLDLRRGY